MKIPTPWNNNQPANPSTWSDAPKENTEWQNNVDKNPTAFVETDKNDTSWNSGVAQVPYLYNDATMMYNDPLRGYNWLTPIANQTNDKLPAVWIPA